MKKTYNVDEKLQKIAQGTEPDPVFAENLWNRIQETPLEAKRNPVLSIFHRKPGWSIVGVLFAGFLVFAAINPTQVYAAFQYVLRYLPGIGFVENGNEALSISTPIENTQDGITIHIDQAVVDTNKTIISYELSADPAIVSDFDACFYDENVLILSNGTELKPIGGGVQGHSAQIEFMPLPAGVDSAELHLSRLFDDAACSAPLVLSAEIAFDSTIESSGLLPVYEAEQIQVGSENEAEPSSASSEDEIADLIHFVIDHLVELENGYLLTGHAEWVSSEIEDVIVNYDAVRLIDANGKAIATAPTEDGTKDSEFALIVQSKDFVSPLTLNIDEVMIGYRPSVQNTFTIDAGDTPVSEQRWNIGKTIDIDGQKVEIIQVQYLEYFHDVTGELIKAFVFDVELPETIHSLDIGFSDKAAGILSSFGENKPLDKTHMQVTLGSQNDLPNGEITFVVGHMMFDKPGKWSLEWQLPEASK